LEVRVMVSRWANIVNRASGFPPAHRRARRQPSPSRTRPALEALEDRCLLSSYNITVIGATIDPPAGSYYAGSGINNAAVVQVVGQSAEAYVWDSIHGMQQIGTVKHEAQSAAISINDAGQVVGRSWTTTVKYDRKTGYPYSTTTENGFLWSSSAGMKDLGSNTAPIGINNSGEIAGNTGSPFGVASLWNGKNWTQLGILPGGYYSIASGINDFGQVAGWSTTSRSGGADVFLWTPSSPNGTIGSMIDLGGGFAAAINAKGQVTGIAVATNGNAFLWTPSSPNGTSGTMIALGTLDPSALGGNGSSWGVALNSSGVVVGASNPTGATSGSQTHAVIWQPGTNGGYTLTDLNTSIPSGTGWTLYQADAINDSGDIVVEATNPNLGDTYALLLTPSTTAAATISTSTQPTGVPPATSTASPQIVSDSNTPLASPLPSGSGFDPAAVLASLGSVPPAAAPAGAPSPARPASPAPPPVLSPVRALPPADQADSFGPGSVSPAAGRAAADQPFADLGAEPASALFGEDLALALPR
jgi:uncharacterized membrane protein